MNNNIKWLHTMIANTDTNNSGIWLGCLIGNIQGTTYITQYLFILNNRNSVISTGTRAAASYRQDTATLLADLDHHVKYSRCPHNILGISPSDYFHPGGVIEALSINFPFWRYYSFCINYLIAPWNYFHISNVIVSTNLFWSFVTIDTESIKKCNPIC